MVALGATHGRSTLVGVVIATHCDVARAMADAARIVLGADVAIEAVSIDAKAERDDAWKALLAAVERADKGGGVLVLTDMFGGTPTNLALALLAERKVEVLTGVNIPMVLRAVEKCSELTLDALASDVLAYGRRNVTAAAELLKPGGGS